MAPRPRLPWAATRLRYCKDHIEEGPIVLTTSYYTMKLSYLQNYDFSSISVHRAMAEHGMEKKHTEKHINVAVLDARSSRLMCVSPGTLALSITSYTRDKRRNSKEKHPWVVGRKRDIFEKCYYVFCCCWSFPCLSVAIAPPKIEIIATEVLCQ